MYIVKHLLLLSCQYKTSEKMDRIEEIDDNGLDFEMLFSKNVVLKEDDFVNKDIVGDAIMARIQASRKRTIRYVWAAASAIIILLTTTYPLSNEEYTSKKSSLAILLPDGSQVQMKENSHLSYNRIAWLWNRTIDFEGTAHFIVTKGQKFIVNTNFGNVEVLGTEFQVEAGAQSLAVECFSGAVGVKTEVGDKILHSNEKLECTPKGMIFTPAKEPLPPYLEFNGVALNDVIARIEELFGVTITPKDICQGIIYDGLLPTDSLREALEIVMSSCGMTYSINGNQIIISHYDE